jgi:hypothetical protein
MNTVNSTRFQQQLVIALATVGLTAAITLAAVGPDAMRAQPPSTVVAPSTESPARIDGNTSRFERSNEPAIEVDLMNAHGG